MAIEKVREYFKQFGMEDRILEFEVSSATVELAAKAVGTEPARIAKIMSFKDGDGCILVSFTDLILRVALAFVFSPLWGTTGIRLSWPVGWIVGRCWHLSSISRDGGSRSGWKCRPAFSAMH